MKLRSVLGLGSILSLLVGTYGCAARETAAEAAEGGAPSTVADQRALQGVRYEPGRRFVQKYCSGCHWKDGQDPKQRVAYPAFHVDTYDDWAASRTILLAVVDKWNPDGDIMPPLDAVEPPDDERRLILDWIRRNSPNTPEGR
jgi:uncharacterized membrane protein